MSQPGVSHTKKPAERLPPMSLLGILPSPIRSPSSLKQHTPKPSETTAATAVRVLRGDLVRMQSFVDAARGKDVLSYGMRLLEAELLEIQAEPPEQQLAPLVEKMILKCSEVGLVLNGAAVSSPMSAARTHSIVAPLLETLSQRGHGDPSGSHLSPMEGTKSPSTPRPGSSRPHSKDAARALADPDRSRTVTPVSDAAENDVGDAVAEVAAPQQRAVNPLLTQDSTAMMRSIGVTIADEDLLDYNIVARKLVDASSTIATERTVLNRRIADFNDQTAHKLRHLQLECDALRDTLRERDIELNEIRRGLSSSRFGFNQPKSLTTVHDEPMSYEVERQYLRDIQRYKLRIEELEQKYKQLYDDGTSDRQRVKDLVAEGNNLRKTIAELEGRIAKLSAEKEESRQLFLGVSRTRAEEARMSLAAVKQLESRIEQIETNLHEKTTQANNLTENIKQLYADWCASQEELHTAQSNFSMTVENFADYKRVYNHSLMDQLQDLQNQRLELSHRCDEQEAAVMVQKQQLEDVVVQKNFSIAEQTQFMEKLKSSTEWKILAVRCQEEMKQLAIRLVVLSGDREKKESSLASQHAERVALFRTRAEKEVKERAEKRRQETPVVDAAQIESELKGHFLKREHHRAKEAQAATKRGKERSSSLLLKDDFVEECCKRAVSVAKYCSDMLHDGEE